MNVKTYKKSSLQEALNDIKRDLGNEALILSTREVRPTRGFGFLRKSKWEVAAAAPRNSTPAATAAVRALVPKEPRKESKTQQPAAEPLNLEKEIALRGTRPDRRIDVLLSEMEDLKRTMKDLGRTKPAKGDSGGGLYGELMILGIDSGLAEELVMAATDRDASPGEVRRRVRSMLADRIMIDAPAELVAKSRMVSVFVGPTGVGKTTTIAKLAGQAAALHNKKVALITTDMLRVGGQDQLSRFGALLNVPAYTCSDVSKLADLVQSLDDRDLILVDTPGASPSDMALLSRLEKVLKLPELRVNLVIAATTRSEDVGRILARFQRFSPQRIIFTKIDETESRGAVVGDLLRYELSITFLTDGQQVPEDLLIPSASEMAKWVLPIE
jgi:flagellar biosynthesis protein FlhF